MNSIFLDRLTPLPSGWTAGTIGEYCAVKTGGTPSTKIPSYYDPPEFFWVKSGDVKRGRIQNPPNQISGEGLAKSAAKLLPIGSVMIAMSGRGKTRGTTAVLEVEAACSQSVAAMIPEKDLASEFLHYQFVKRYDEIRNITGSDDRSGLNLALIRAIPIALPPLPEQKKIAHILSTVQRAIEAQERIIQITTELKKALMHKLFTEGLHSEPQKQTEIGPIPKSWKLVRCEDACETTSVGIVVKPTKYYVPAGIPALRSQNVRADRMQMEPMVYISKEANDGPVAKSKLRTGDVLIVRTGANLGMSCVLPEELDGCNCIDLLFIRTIPSRLNGSFLSRFINSVEAKKQVGAGKTGMAQPHFNVGTVKRIFVPLPPLDEQNEIVSCLEQIDRKHDLAEAKRKSIRDLFRTLLHELMTAKTRVHQLTFREQSGAS